jgi:hypothetical protein
VPACPHIVRHRHLCTTGNRAIPSNAEDGDMIRDADA